MSLELNIKLQNPAIISAHGRIDTVSSPEFSDAILETVGKSKEATGSYPDIVLDPHDVTFFSTTALYAMLDTHESLAQINNQLVLIASDKVKRVLEIAGFEDFFTLAENQALALESLQQAK